MNEKAIDATKEVIRAAFRPFLITLLCLGTFYFVTMDISGEWVDWWNRLFFAGAGEWIVERPVIKITSKLKLKK